MTAPTLCRVERDMPESLPENPSCVDIAIETGKLLLLPVRLRVRGPMDEFCFYAPLPAMGASVFVETSSPAETRRRRLVRVLVSSSVPEAKGFQKIGRVSGGYRWLLCGDVTFVRTRYGSEAERFRVGEALRRHRSIGGSFRLDDGQVGAVVRFGTKTSPVRVIVLRADGETSLCLDISLLAQLGEGTAVRADSTVIPE